MGCDVSRTCSRDLDEASEELQDRVAPVEREVDTLSESRSKSSSPTNSISLKTPPAQQYAQQLPTEQRNAPSWTAAQRALAIPPTFDEMCEIISAEVERQRATEQSNVNQTGMPQHQPQARVAPVHQPAAADVEQISGDAYAELFAALATSDRPPRVTKQAVYALVNTLLEGALENLPGVTLPGTTTATADSRTHIVLRYSPEVADSLFATVEHDTAAGEEGFGHGTAVGEESFRYILDLLCLVRLPATGSETNESRKLAQHRLMLLLDRLLDVHHTGEASREDLRHVAVEVILRNISQLAHTAISISCNWFAQSVHFNQQLSCHDVKLMTQPLLDLLAAAVSNAPISISATTSAQSRFKAQPKWRSSPSAVVDQQYLHKIQEAVRASLPAIFSGPQDKDADLAPVYMLVGQVILDLVYLFVQTVHNSQKQLSKRQKPAAGAVDGIRLADFKELCAAFLEQHQQGLLYELLELIQTICESAIEQIEADDSQGDLDDEQSSTQAEELMIKLELVAADRNVDSAADPADKAARIDDLDLLEQKHASKVDSYVRALFAKEVLQLAMSASEPLRVIGGTLFDLVRERIDASQLYEKLFRMLMFGSNSDQIDSRSITMLLGILQGDIPVEEWAEQLFAAADTGGAEKLSPKQCKAFYESLVEVAAESGRCASCACEKFTESYLIPAAVECMFDISSTTDNSSIKLEDLWIAMSLIGVTDKEILRDKYNMESTAIRDRHKELIEQVHHSEQAAEIRGASIRFLWEQSTLMQVQWAEDLIIALANTCQPEEDKDLRTNDSEQL